MTLHDSTVGAKGKAGDSAVDLSGKKLDEDELVLGGSGTGSDVTIGGDSGISLVDPADSGLSLEDPIELGVGADESLELGEAEMIAVEGGSAARGKTGDDDFLLTPLEEAGDAEDSESGSQVIALDTEEAEMIGAGTGPSMAAMLDEDVGGGMMDMAGMGMAGAAGLGMGAMGAPMPDAEATLPEKPYTTWNIVALVACTLFLTFCGWFMYDVLRNMWSWDAPYTVSSPMMDTIIGWFEK